MKRITLTALTVATIGIGLVLGAVSFAGEKPAPAPPDDWREDAKIASKYIDSVLKKGK